MPLNQILIRYPWQQMLLNQILIRYPWLQTPLNQILIRYPWQQMLLNQKRIGILLHTEGGAGGISHIFARRNRQTVQTRWLNGSNAQSRRACWRPWGR